jgi:hypothetical protein
MCAFDLIELDGEDLRRTPIEQRKRKLAKLVRGPHPGIVLNGFSKVTATSSLPTPANSAARASRASGSARSIGLTLAALGEGQKSEGTRRDPRGGRGLGPLIISQAQFEYRRRLICFRSHEARACRARLSQALCS